MPRLTALCVFLAMTVWSQSGSRIAGPYAATPQRPTFTSGTSTTAPGTVELEIGGTFADGVYTVPTTLKFTPDASKGFFEQGEFSVGFDSVSVVSAGGRRVTQFGDRLAFGYRRPVYRGGSLSFAVAPQGTVFVRGDSGGRLGLVGLMAQEAGQNSVAVNVSWSAALGASPANPANVIALASDFARQIAATGAWNRLSVFAGVLYENASGSDGDVALGQGVACRVRPNIVLDVAVRQTGLATGSYDHQILAGVTVNLGKPAEW